MIRNKLYLREGGGGRLEREIERGERGSGGIRKKEKKKEEGDIG